MHKIKYTLLFIPRRVNSCN